MDKQRMSNILSSVQMSPRDRKDFIEELSKLGQGGEGSGEGELKLEPPVIIPGEYDENFYDEIKYYVDKGIACKVAYHYFNSFIPNNSIGNVKSITMQNQSLEFIYFVCHIKTTGMYTTPDNVDIDTMMVICMKTDGKTMIQGIQTIDETVKQIIGDVPEVFKFPLLSCFELLQDSAGKTLDVINGLDLNKHYNCVLKKANDVRVFGSYYNGTFTAFERDKIQVYNVDLNTGAITLSQSINPELIGTVAKLEVGDADDVCQRNLELINMAIAQTSANHFDVDIDYGVGSATFTQGLADDAIAGTATIIVATGYVTKYNLYGNGKVEKVGNDIDLFVLEARIAALENA